MMGKFNAGNAFFDRLKNDLFGIQTKMQEIIFCVLVGFAFTTLFF